MTGPRSAHPEFVSQPTWPWTFGEQDKSNSYYQSFKSNNFFDAKNLARHAPFYPVIPSIPSIRHIASSEHKALQIKTPLKITNSQSFAEFICKCDNISVLLDCSPLKAGKVLQNRKTLTTLPAEYKVIEKYYWQMFWKRRVTQLSDLKSNKPYSFTNLYLNLTASLQPQFKATAPRNEIQSCDWQVSEEPDIVHRQSMVLPQQLPLFTRWWHHSTNHSRRTQPLLTTQNRLTWKLKK